MPLKSSYETFVITLFYITQSLELTSLPVGLTDEYDSFVQSIQPFRLQNGKESEHKEKIYSSTFPKFERSQDINARSSRSPIHIAAGVTDSAEFSSTVNLTPLSVATLKEDKSSRQLWLDSMCLAVGLFYCINEASINYNVI